VVLHVSEMDHLDCFRNNRPSITTSTRREQTERNVEEGRARRGMGRGRGRRAESDVYEFEPETQPKPHHVEEEEMEV